MASVSIRRWERFISSASATWSAPRCSGLPAPVKAEAPRSAARTLLQQYLAHLAHERRLSPNTLAAYERDIDALIEGARETALSDLRVHEIRRLVAQLHAKGLDPRSIRRMLSAWRGFYRYLARDHGYGDNPALGIRAPKAPKRLPQALSPDDAQRLLEMDTDSALGLRDKAMFELFYSSGL